MLSFRLHSKYNPHKEAQQFAAAVEGSPSIILISEPGESYLAEALHMRFPEAKLIAVRYTDSLFCESDSFWDAVWRPQTGSLSFFLVSHIPDEKLASTRFLSWKPADKAFPEESTVVWKDIRQAIEIIKSVMHTRSFFGIRWLKNTVYNFINLVHPAAADFGTRDFILAGAGPSLQTLCAQDIQPYSLAAVCSAYPALAAKGILPDLCISTDGGYWALRHFDSIPETIPAAFPLEAAIPASILEHNPCIPLSYGSPLEQVLFSAAGFMPIAARENGTVTGTACELLLQHTEKNIILAGLDLAPSLGFSHAQPHHSTIRVSAAADRLQPLAGMLAVQNFHTRSLETYRQWFLQLPPEKTHRLFRTGTGGCPLPNIRHIDSPAGLPKRSGKPAAAVSTKPFSVWSYPAVSSLERKKAVKELLITVQKRITALIGKNAALLTTEKQSLEQQICLLCAYTAYCNFIKDTEHTEMQTKLCEHIGRVLNPLIKRIDHDCL